MTFLGYYLHWSHDELMTLEHRERRRWCTEVSQINKKLSGQKEKERKTDRRNARGNGWLTVHEFDRFQSYYRRYRNSENRNGSNN